MNLQSFVTSPSNIAFVKYWGKKDSQWQWPANPSLSMTLSNSKTETSAKIIDAKSDIIEFTNGLGKTDKGLKHLEWLRTQFPDFKNKKLHIKTHNTFPTACGIASSASGMSALTLAALSSWTQQFTLKDLAKIGLDQTKLAQLSRMGSGSAGRSLWGGYVAWEPSTNAHQQSIYQAYDEKHWSLSDLIMIVDSTEKKHLSSAAHKSAWSSPLFSVRLTNMDKKLQLAKEAIAEKSIEKLGEIIEQDALEMHSVMMTSSPSSNYFTEKTIEIISTIRALRNKGDLEAWFTIDAGPNVHVICESKNKVQILKSLNMYFPNLNILEDHVGQGPTLKQK